MSRIIVGSSSDQARNALGCQGPRPLDVFREANLSVSSRSAVLTFLCYRVTRAGVRGKIKDMKPHVKR